MSIYQGARLRTTRLPAATVASPRLPAATVVAPRPAASRSSASSSAAQKVGDDRRPVILVGGVVAVALVAFVYLTNTLGANASNAEITRLASDRESYQNQLITQRSIITKKLADGNIEQMALDLGLTDLGQPLIVSLP